MATYYVDPSGGSDVAAGTTFGTAWATTQKALDTVVAGDEVRLCKSATETISAVIDLDTTNATVSDPITLISYAADGSAASDGYTISTSASISAIVEHAPGYDYYRWIGVTFDANDAATNSYLNDGSDGADNNTLINCVLKNATQDNFNVRGGSWLLSNCEITGAGRYGISHSAANRGSIGFYNGKLHNNGNHGWFINRSGAVLLNSLIYRNGGWGVNTASNSGSARIIGNTFYGNTSGGYFVLDASGRNPIQVVDNTFVANGTYGFNAGDTDRFALVRTNNHHFGNTSGGTNVTNGLGSDLITGDPLFTSTTDGSEDFTPGSGSPLIGSGLNGQHIGARGAAPGGGGGGGTVGFAL